MRQSICWDGLDALRLNHPMPSLLDDQIAQQNSGRSWTGTAPSTAAP
jgi:hypothetical protein